MTTTTAPATSAHRATSITTVVSRDGTQIAVGRAGHGPALVIVDGAFCTRENGPAEAVPGYTGRVMMRRLLLRSRGEAR